MKSCLVSLWGMGLNEVSLSVHCGDAVFKRFFERWLEAEGLQVSHEGTLQLLVDRHLGWAGLERPDVDFGRCVILSDNPCPTYLLDLLNKQPAALVSLADLEALPHTLEKVQAGN